MHGQMGRRSSASRADWPGAWPHRAGQLREVLPRPLHDEAQPEDGAVQVGRLVEQAVLQVAILAHLDVAPEDAGRRWVGILGRQLPPGSPLPPEGSYLENWNLG